MTLKNLFRPDIERFSIYQKIPAEMRTKVWIKAQMRAVASLHGLLALTLFVTVFFGGLRGFAALGLEGSFLWAILPALIAGYGAGEVLARGASRLLQRQFERREPF